MGNTGTKEAGVAGRSKAITGGGTGQKGKASLPKLPPNAVKANPDDYPFLEVGVACCCLYDFATLVHEVTSCIFLMHVGCIGEVVAFQQA